MIPQEIFKKVRTIELHTKKLVNDVFVGEYHSVFKGRGIEFNEVREYGIGDDIRLIDWNVTARTGHPYVKIYEEERELTVMLMVDASSSGFFGTKGRLKEDLAAEISAVLAFSAINNNDRVGLIMFTDRIELFIPPQKGRKHVLRVIREILYSNPTGKLTNIKKGVEYLNHMLNRRAIVFLISDFMDNDFEPPLKVSARKHDLIAITIRDEREEKMPESGVVFFEDAETGERHLVDTSSEKVRSDFSNFMAGRKKELNDLFRRNNIDQIEVSTGKDYFDELAKFFNSRIKQYS